MGSIDLRAAAQQALEAWQTATYGHPSHHKATLLAMTALNAALAQPTLQTCNCRWDGEVQVQQCTLHEAHVDAIHEWAERAKTAEKKLAAITEPVQEPVAWWKRHRDGSVELNDARTFIAEDAIATGRRPLIFGDTSPPQRPAESVQEPVIGPCEHALIEVLAERDGAEEYIDAILDEVLGPDRAEWSSAYGRADALEEVHERIAQMLKPSIDKAWNRFEVAPPQTAEPVQEPVAWMDIDENGNRLTVRQWSDGNKEEVPLYTHPPQRPAEPVGIVSSLVKGGVVWRRWPADMPDGTRLFSEVQP